MDNLNRKDWHEREGVFLVIAELLVILHQACLDVIFPHLIFILTVLFASPFR